MGGGRRRAYVQVAQFGRPDFALPAHQTLCMAALPRSLERPCTCQKDWPSPVLLTSERCLAALPSSQAKPCTCQEDCCAQLGRPSPEGAPGDTSFVDGRFDRAGARQARASCVEVVSDDDFGAASC